MSLAIQLLGTPSVTVEGVPGLRPHGRKVWGLLALLLLTEPPPSRRRLAEVLFSEADDPLRALRWTLTELRRLLGPAATVGGDPAILTLPPDAVVDVRVLHSTTWPEALELPGFGRDLLEGVEVPASAAFEGWLLAQRRHLDARTRDLLRQAAEDLVVANRPERAVDLAIRLAALDPFDPSVQALVVRCYVATGDREGAEQRGRLWIELFRRELGLDPTPEVRRALRSRVPARNAGPWTDADLVQVDIETGTAALRAGATDAGLEILRRAAGIVRDLSRPDLEADAFLALGSALVHAGRSAHAEGAVALARALELGRRHGDRTVVAASLRDLAWADLLVGRYEEAERQLAASEAHAAGDDELLASIGVVRGWLLSEVGQYGAASSALQQAEQRARGVDADDIVCVARMLTGRSHLLRHELAEARPALEEALELARRGRWRSFMPAPEKYLGTVELLEGRISSAGELIRHAYASAVRMGDVCMETGAGRGLGLMDSRQGDLDGALEHLEQARLRPVLTPDHRWSGAWALDTLCTLGTAHRLPTAGRWVADLTALAGRTGMRDFLARSHLHRFALHGDDTSLEAAARVAEGVDNPYLHHLVASEGRVEMAAVGF